jgi:drug/metabolite transporter (DMT)-like permease
LEKFDQPVNTPKIHPIRIRASEFKKILMTSFASQQNLRRLAVFVLLFCCVCWGFSFPAMQRAAALLEQTVKTKSALQPDLRLSVALRATFNGWRFGSAALLYLLLTGLRPRRYSTSDYIGGITVGAAFGFGIFLQILGLRYTIPSISGFLTSLAVIFAPLAQSILFRRRVGLRTWLAVIFAVVGILLLSRPNPGASAAQTVTLTPPFPHLGEILTILGSLLFTTQILALDHFGQSANSIHLTTVMLFTCAAVNLMGGLALCGRHLYNTKILLPLFTNSAFLTQFSILIIFSSVVALHLMNRFQPLLTAATASVIYCAEPVFVVLFSVALSNERFTAITAIGGAVTLLAVLIVIPTGSSTNPAHPPATP